MKAFTKLWVGQSGSEIGSQVSLMALPLIAAITLSATPAQIGYLGFLQHLTGPLWSLLAGVVIDTISRRNAMIACNIGECLFLALIPLLYVLGQLSLPWLYVIGFFVASFRVYFDTAYQSIVPILVPKSELVIANSRLEMTRSGAQLVGPGIAGLLVGLLGPVLAILADCLTFVFSAVVFSSLPKEKKQVNWVSPSVGDAIHQIREGVQTVIKSPILLVLASTAAIFNFFATAIFTQYILYILRVLGMQYQMVTAVLIAAAMGFLVGAILAKPIINGLGTARTMIIAAVIGDTAFLAVPLSTDAGLGSSIAIVSGFMIFTCGAQVYNISQISLRQRIVPDELLSRVTGTIRFVALSSAPLGALLGGLFASYWGLRELLFVCIAGLLLAPIYLYFSPFVRLVRESEETASPTDGMLNQSSSQDSSHERS